MQKIDGGFWQRFAEWNCRSRRNFCWGKSKGKRGRGASGKRIVIIGAEVLPNIHRVASLLTRWLLGTHQSYMNTNKLEYYLDEYTFRYNRKKSNSRGLLFYPHISRCSKKKQQPGIVLIKPDIFMSAFMGSMRLIHSCFLFKDNN